jgi:topoisomerase IV subunit A
MEGVSTLGGLDIYYDPSIGRLNTDHRGKKIGNFLGEDRIVVFYKNGDYELTTFELTNRYESSNVLLIEKFDPEKTLSAIYYDGGSKTYFVKRFLIETTSVNKKFNIISDHKQSYLKLVSSEKQPQVKVLLQKGKEQEEQEYDLDMLIDVKGWKAIGNKLSSHQIIEINLIQAEPKKPEEEATGADSPETDEDLEIGSTVEFKVKKDEEDKDQLGLF